MTAKEGYFLRVIQYYDKTSSRRGIQMFNFEETVEQAKTFFKDHIATMTVHDGLNALEWSKP